MRYLALLVLVLMSCIQLAIGQSDAAKQPVVIEPLKDSECLNKVLNLESYLFKTSLNDLNTPEFLYYGIDPVEVKERFPYLVTKDSSGNHTIKYERFTPILIEALEEMNELHVKEQKKRIRLEEDFENYKITMENHLNQLNYQLEMLKSEIDGINEGLGVQNEPSE